MPRLTKWDKDDGGGWYFLWWQGEIVSQSDDFQTALKKAQDDSFAFGSGVHIRDTKRRKWACR